MGRDDLQIIKMALKEDIGNGDITTEALFPNHIKIKAEVIAKEAGVVCGAAVAKEVFKAVERKIRKDKRRIRENKGKDGRRRITKEKEGCIRIYNRVKDGARVKKGQVVCVVEGDARVILAGERTALNFLGRLSGVATLTRKYADAVKPYKVKILDTRKTTPGLRELEKYAVRRGGGANHRMGLYDQALVKDNHIEAFSVQRSEDRKSLKEIIEKVKKGINKGMKIEIEVENLRQFKEVLEADPDIIMLDNMCIADIKKAVAIKNELSAVRCPLSAKLEVSGGVTLDNVRNIAAAGVDMISVGALTHSAPSIDFSLEIAGIK